MNNPVYSFFSFSCFFMALFFGGTLIFAALGNISHISNVAQFLGVCLFLDVGMIIIWLGWWFKRAVTGRRGLMFGWNWTHFLTKPPGPDAKFNKFRFQAIYLFGSLVVIVALLYLNTMRASS